MPDRPQNLRWADTVADELVGRIEKTRDQQRLGAKPRRKYEYSLQEAGKLHRNEGRERLERFERALRVLYDNGVRLGDQQRELVNEVTTALLPKFFGDDLVANLIYLRKKFGLTDISDTKSMIFPRRSGKTEGCAIIIAALAVSQPRGNCIMYNLTATQAKEFLQSVYKHLKVCACGGPRLTALPSSLLLFHFSLISLDLQ